MRRVRAALLVALLLVPVLLHGHRHDTTKPTTAAPCAVCLAVHHTPAVGFRTVAIDAPLVSALAISAPALVYTPSAVLPRHPGRAPPSSASLA